MPQVLIKVFRCNPKISTETKWDTFYVETYKNMTVLDALFEILRAKDATVSFRCSCRLGMCGSCAMVINGKERLACRTKVADLGDTITVKPLNNLPIIKDLVVDMEPFFQKYESIIPYFIGKDDEVAKTPSRSPARRLIDDMLDCITCGACYSACSMVAFDKEYLGPAALNRAYCLLADDRDAAFEERFRRINHEHGIWRCHTQFDCMEVCPKNIIPTWSIQQLKNEAVLRGLSRYRKIEEGRGAPMGEEMAGRQQRNNQREKQKLEINSKGHGLEGKRNFSKETTDEASEKAVSRKEFLKKVALSLVGITSISPLLIGIRSTLSPVTVSEAKQPWISLGDINQYEEGKPTLTTFEHPLKSGKSIRRSVYVLRESNEVVVYDAACTHLGCPVRWNEEAQMFFSPCHGGVFNKKGEVVAGPPPRPLDRYECEVRNNELFIKDFLRA
ncbi:succinate dehydrogenase iron-sulfur subunit [Calderihabitans maritimus]|uniref:Fumarate reductase iron-sulfur subunit n=1 Tax=Calderihabitans maritimus TaxID=1246530 RepID=A0A1Z5HV54_9FIRM|nr:succinate dehydrogenase iron-sulfur subunit [Calderihabitans maritimus]GAW93215.1 succinate dehydrogenase and fumarate reductase iron-sulfur protein [Calderihabitans maritimus]